MRFQPQEQWEHRKRRFFLTKYMYIPYTHPPGPIAMVFIAWTFSPLEILIWRDGLRNLKISLGFCRFINIR